MIRQISLLVLLIYTFSFSQNRVLLHIGADGKQEAIPINTGERPQDVIARIERMKASLIEKESSPTGLFDTLRNYPGEAMSDVNLTSNFGFTHQEIGLQWFVPQAWGKVKEVWWRNYSKQGDIKKATIRAWYVNPKLATIPAANTTKYLGAYKDPTDGDGLVTPFKPATGDQWFYGNGLADSATYRFDPLGTEAPKWLPGGLQVTLDSGKWQGIKLEQWGDSMVVNLNQLFGFTISNDTRISDISGGTGTGDRMEILSFTNSNPAPYHSLKWYENGRTSTNDKGWYLRGDYEWGMYVVVEYTTGCSPKIILPQLLGTAIKTTPREICFDIHSCDSLKEVWFKFKKGSLSFYDSIPFNCIQKHCCVTIPMIDIGDTVYWSVVATTIYGNRTVFGPRNFVVFKKNHSNLLIYNNSTFSVGNSGANLIYTGGNADFDRWSAPIDGIGELDDLLAMYNNVIIADGGFPSQNIFKSLKTWFSKGTAEAKKNLFFTSQDYGCYITNTCADTTFSAGSWEFDYLGLEKLGPQDLGPTNRPYKIVPQTDAATNYLIKFNTDSATTLWHYPIFELTSTYSAYPDGMTPKAGAKAIFKDGAGINTLGVLNKGATFNSMFVGFDAGALQFRSDTSLHNTTYTTITDPKYHWIVDIGSLSLEFFKSYSNVKPGLENIPNQYSLGQNYPNPFNPNTVIDFSIPARENVQIIIYNILGQKVSMVTDQTFEEGKHSVQWNAQSFASGLYFYEMRSGSFSITKKMMLLK